MMDNICQTIWALDQGALRVFHGNYSAWLAQQQREHEFAQFEYQQYRNEKHRLEQAKNQVVQEGKNMVRLPRRMSSSEWMLYKDIAARQQKNVQNRATALAKRIERLEEKEKPVALPQIQMPLGALQSIVSRQAVTVSNLTVGYQGENIVRSVNFQVPTGRRTVMIGPNGAGKTTIIKQILEGHQACRLAPNMTIGYFGQNHELLDLTKTVLENAKQGSHLAEHEVRSILAYLNFKQGDLSKRGHQLSGGERSKVAFAQLLASENHLLILDEPTNHLDHFACEALEQLLLKWQGTLLVITHDRKLVQAIAQRIVVVDQGMVTSFEGDWQAYMEAEKGIPAQTEATLDKAMLQMRMAELSYRLSNPHKGDDLVQLEQQWQMLLSQYQAVTNKY